MTWRPPPPRPAPCAQHDFVPCAYFDGVAVHAWRGCLRCGAVRPG